MPTIERLRGENAAERSYATVPDSGLELARRIHEQADLRCFDIRTEALVVAIQRVANIA